MELIMLAQIDSIYSVSDVVELRHPLTNPIHMDTLYGTKPIRIAVKLASMQYASRLL